MEVIKSKAKLRDGLDGAGCKGLRIGFVPTMGFLHEGHLSLVKKAKEKSDLVVVSIFVNPAQFNDLDDFESYPMDLERDLKLLEEADVDVVFVPDVEEVYGEGELTVSIACGDLTEVLCGRTRPGHFEGVMLVLSKFFNIVRPDLVFLGQKDYQQCKVVERLIKDLDFDIDLVIGETVRNDRGLALSSRNVRLSDNGLKKAEKIVQILCSAEEAVRNGERDTEKLKLEMVEGFQKLDSVGIDYVEILRAEDLSKIETIDCEVVIAVAVIVEGVRLIDNVIVKG